MNARFQKTGGQPVNNRVDYVLYPWNEELKRYIFGIPMKRNGEPANTTGRWSYKDACSLVETGHWERMPDSEDIPSTGMDDVW